ncbi:ABC transporter substrate-binding protein [Bacillus sp. B15-48]|uniref:ABC transporter substrate-binding protein n=1 Tax=Bacillus sp. B15-48 TaxID=1548601 RepID=UPI00193F6108|nr:ABC transporter substrate-binding protein [Bacillus sp. B15-48]MBM4763015.1 ABC transporter substrate-binding protein [Bacillus sp. B15-48]
MKKNVVIMILFMIVLVGCNSQETAGQVEKVSSNEEKTLNLALFWLDSNIEPTEGWNGWTLSRLGIGETLIRFDEHMELQPVIAESWEQVDETTTDFTIREGVKFHNGNKVDAEAVKASIERALNISDRDDVKFPLKSMTADGQILTIQTTEPFATLLNNLADPVFTIVDTTDGDSEDIKFKPVATGAFKVIQFTPDIGLTLHKHEAHWSGEIGVDVVTVKYIQDASTRTMALQSGEIDFATQIGAKDLTLFENNEEFHIQKGPNLRIFLLRLNMDKPYMQNLQFRQALSYGIDKETYATKIVNGLPAKGPFNDLLSFGHKGEDFYSYDPEKAKELLDQAGFVDTDGDGIREADGENIVLKFVSRTNHGSDANNIGTAMQAQYKEIGIGMEIIQVENYADMANSGDFDLLWERWTSAPTADPQYFLKASFLSGSAGNYGNYDHPDLDEIVKQLDHTLDKAERDRLGMKGAEILMADVASLFLYYQEGTVVTRKNVDGVYRFISELYYIDERIKVN